MSILRIRLLRLSSLLLLDTPLQLWLLIWRRRLVQRRRFLFLLFRLLSTLVRPLLARWLVPRRLRLRLEWDLSYLCMMWYA